LKLVRMKTGAAGLVEGMKMAVWSLEAREEGGELIWSHHRVDLGCSRDWERDLEAKQHLAERSVGAMGHDSMIWMHNRSRQRVLEVRETLQK